MTSERRELGRVRDAEEEEAGEPPVATACGDVDSDGLLRVGFGRGQLAVKAMLSGDMG